MDRPIVTLGVCVKNGEESLGETLESIVNQDHPHELMEVIFVDDGSKDRTLSIMKDYAFKTSMKVKVFHQEWRGLGPARNVVVDNTSGKYIVWVDGDMRLSRDYVSKQVEFMERNPTVGIANGKTEFRLVEDLITNLEFVWLLARDYKYGGKATSELRGVAGAIYRAKAIRQVGGFDDHIKGAGEDIDAAFRIRKAGWLVHFSTGAVFYIRRQKTWKDLWDKHFWYGYGAHYVCHKNRGMIHLYEMLPPAGFLSGLLYSFVAYRIMHRKIVFMLPLQFMFSKTAWCVGFVKSHVDGYGIRSATEDGVCRDDEHSQETECEVDKNTLESDNERKQPCPRSCGPALDHSRGVYVTEFDSYSLLLSYRKCKRKAGRQHIG